VKTSSAPLARPAADDPWGLQGVASMRATELSKSDSWVDVRQLVCAPGSGVNTRWSSCIVWWSQLAGALAVALLVHSKSAAA
jgi:hypothetical protein